MQQINLDWMLPALLANECQLNHITLSSPQGAFLLEFAVNIMYWNS
jgi:hypothetical protein